MLKILSIMICILIQFSGCSPKGMTNEEKDIWLKQQSLKRQSSSTPKTTHIIEKKQNTKTSPRNNYR